MAGSVVKLFSSVWRPIFMADISPNNVDLVEFSKQLHELLKILSCTACGQLLTNREVVSSAFCKEHFACKACVGKERDEDRKCENCEDWDTFESDQVIQSILESYQSCCGYFLHSKNITKQLERIHKSDPTFDALRLIDLLGEGIKGMPIKRKLPNDMLMFSSDEEDDDDDDDDDITCMNEIKRTKLSHHDDRIPNSVNANNTSPTTPSSSQSVSPVASTVTKICVDAETQTDAKEEFVKKKNTKEQEVQAGPSYKSFTVKATQSMPVSSVVTKTITTNTHQGVASSGTVSLTPVPVPNPLPISTVKPVSKQIPSRVTTPVKHPVPVPAVSSPCRDIKSTISVSSSANPTKQGATVVKTLLPSPSAQSTPSSSSTKQLAPTSTTSISTTTVQIMPSKSCLTNAKLVASVSSTPATTKQLVTASPTKEVSKSSVSIPSVSKLSTPPVSVPSVSKMTAQTGTPTPPPSIFSDTKDIPASSSSLVSTLSISTNNSKVVPATSKIGKVEPPYSTPPRASPSPEKITASPLSTPKTSPEKILIITSDIQNELHSARRSSGEPSPSPSEDVPPSPTKTSPSPTTSLPSTPPLSAPSTPTSTTGSPLPMKFTSSFISSGLGGRGTQFLQIAQPGGGYKTVAISPQHLRLASNVALQGRLPGSIVPIQVVNSARLPKPSGAPTTGTETVRIVNASSFGESSTSSTSSGSHGKAYITIQDIHRWPDPHKILQYASGDLARLPLNPGHFRAGFISMASAQGSSGLQGARFQTTPVGNIIRTSSASLGSLGSLVRPGIASSAPTTNQTATIRNSQPQTLQIVRTTSLAGGAAAIRPHVNSVPTSTTIIRQVTVSTPSSNSPTIIVADPSSSITTSAALSSSLSRRREGCRCGNAAANPGKLTCIGQRCACYAERNACSECKCKGCKNPYLPGSGGKKVLHGVRALLEPQISQGIPLVATAVNPGDLGGTSATVLSGNGNGSTATVLTSNPSSNTVMASSFGTMGAPPGATPPYQIIPVRFGLSGAPQYLQISNPHALQQIPIILSNSGQLQTASQAASGIAIQGIPLSSLGAAGIHQISQARPTPTQLNINATKPPE